MLGSVTVNQSDTFKKMFGGQLRYLGNLAKTWPGYEQIGEKLLRFYDNFNNNLVNSAARRPTDITVLNHGDLWVNNFMFKYGQGQRPIDSLLVRNGIFFFYKNVYIYYL